MPDELVARELQQAGFRTTKTSCLPVFQPRSVKDAIDAMLCSPPLAFDYTLLSAKKQGALRAELLEDAEARFRASELRLDILSTPLTVRSWEFFGARTADKTGPFRTTAQRTAPYSIWPGWARR